MIPLTVRRPSHKELTGKIKAAIDLFDSGRPRSASPEKLLANFVELGLYSTSSQLKAIGTVLGEISPECYCGHFPPEKSYEPITKGAELLAFRWESEHFGHTMYVKFSILGSGEDRKLYLYSLHQDRFPK